MIDYATMLMRCYWFLPTQSRKQHIFDDISRKSLCGKWGSLGFDRDHPGAAPIGADEKQQKDDCAGCWTRRKKIHAKAS